MKIILCSTDTLPRLSLFTVLGIAIFLSGCSDYSHTQRYISESEIANTWLREYVEFNWSAPPDHKKHTGSQNVHELMSTFNADYNRGHPKTEVSIYGIKTGNYISVFTERKIDARYPREEWLQHLLDRGVLIENFGDYARCLSKRHTLALLEDNPNLRPSDILDIPPTADWETYKAAYIDKLANDHSESLGTREQSHRSEIGPFRSVNIIESFHTRESSN